MIAKPLRLVSLSLALIFPSEQILLAFPGEGSLLFPSPTRDYGSGPAGEEKGFISPSFFSPKTPYIGEFEGLPKTSSLKQAGWFKKLFRKIAKFFSKVIQAVVKVIQKVVSAITKFVTAAFGKSIGKFVGSILQAPINFLLNTAHYLGQGDFKGLFKYWGQVALQVALMVVVAIVAPYVLGTLFAFAGILFQGLGAFLGAIGGFLANTVPLLGQVLGGALSLAGKALTFAGQVLSRVGTKLITQSKELFQNLKDQGLRGIFKQFKDRLLDQINPLRNLKIGTGDGRIDGIRIPGACPGLSFVSCTGDSTGLIRSLGGISEKQLTRLSSSFQDSGLFKIIQKVGEAISFQWLQNKIDQKIEKSKMNSFWKGILHTLTSVGTQALSAAAIAAGAAILGPAAGALKGAASFLGQGLATIGRAVATGANYLYQGIKTVGSYLYQGAKAIGSFIGQGLQSLGRGIGNTFNATKSFFSNLGQKIFGTKQPPVNAPTLERGRGFYSLTDASRNGRIEILKNTLGDKVALASNGSGDPNKLIRGPREAFDLEKLDEITFRAATDEGNLTQVRLDPATKRPSVEQIGNLLQDVNKNGVDDNFERQLGRQERRWRRQVEAPFDLKDAGPLLQRELHLIATTQRGEELIERLRNEGRTIKIIEATGKRLARFDGLESIEIDSNYLRQVQLQVRRSDGSVTNIVPSEFRVLAHELGHAATGFCDPAITCPSRLANPGDNVIYNENPIVVERGLRERYSYYTPPPISNPIDEEIEAGL